MGGGSEVQVFEAVEDEVKRDDPRRPRIRKFLRQVLGAAAEPARNPIKALPGLEALLRSANGAVRPS